MANANTKTEEKWLNWAKRLQALAQNGLAYCTNPYDIERYQQLRTIAVEIMDHYTEAGETKIRDLFCGEEGYQTPKVDVRGAVIHDGKILLVREKLDGKWSLPGGWADVGLSVKENTEKEVREEAGLCVSAERLVGILDWIKNRDVCPFSLYKIFMLCRLQGGEFCENIETDAMGFFDLDNLPPLSHRVNRESIQMCFDAWKNYHWVPVVE